MIRRAACAVLLATLAGCDSVAPAPAQTCATPFSDQGDVRVFAVAHRIALSDAESYRTFEASYRRHLDALRPCLSDARPNLLVFPEDTGLTAWFIGRQAMAGRHADTSADAFNGLYAQSTAASDAYRARFPGISAARGLTLALSDRAWRAVDRTFGGIAADAKAWVITSANLPVSDRLTEGAPVATFADPDGDGSAYVARGPELFNAALVYGPEGTRVGRVDKAFLTEAEETTLDLSNGPISTMEVQGLPFGRVGIAISRDAFYPPFAQRLEDLGAELVVQPEAFSGWAGEEHKGDWLPEVMLAAGWSMNQKFPGVRHSVAPMLTGNLFEIFFDGQAFITQKGEGTPDLALMGLGPLPGFVAVSPWAFDDDLTMAVADRRSQLRAQGTALLPKSGKPQEGKTYDGFIAADLGLPNGRKQAPVAVNEDPAAITFAVDPTGAGNQRNASVAFDVGGRFYVAFEDDRSGSPRIRFSLSTDGGKTFIPSREVRPSTRPQHKPALVSVGGGVIAIAWQEGFAGAERVHVEISKTAGGRFDSLTVEDAGVQQWDPALTFDDDGDLWLAWTDFRKGLVPEVRLARYPANARTAAPSCAIDETTRDLERLQAAQFQPALISLNGQVGIGWIDGRHGDWEVHARVSKTPCDETAPAPRVSLPDDTEVLAGSPAWAFSPDGRLLLSWDEIRNRGGFHDVNGAQWQQGIWSPLQLSPTLILPRSLPSPVFHDGTFQIFVQDLSSTGRATIGRMDVADLGFLDDPVRVDGAGEAPLSLQRPRAAARLTAAGGAVAFEDARDGWTRIRVQPF